MLQGLFVCLYVKYFLPNVFPSVVRFVQKLCGDCQSLSIYIQALLSRSHLYYQGKSVHIELKYFYLDAYVITSLRFGSYPGDSILVFQVWLDCTAGVKTIVCQGPLGQCNFFCDHREFHIAIYLVPREIFLPVKFCHC